MLVLSRRADQQIVFPNLDIKLQVLQVKGKVVKLGIEAPANVPIIRPEACDEQEIEAFRENFQGDVDRHQLRNRLNAINLGLRLFQKQSELELHEQAEVTMKRVVEELQKLDGDIGTAKNKLKQPTLKRPLRLLVVDDEDNERELLAGLLRLHGFHVDVACNGAEAIDFLGHNEIPDFVLLDMKMPQADGPTTLRQIRADDRLTQLKVFAVSGTSPEDCGIENGCAGWFPKPLDPERLIQAMIPDLPLTQCGL